MINLKFYVGLICSLIVLAVVGCSAILPDVEVQATQQNGIIPSATTATLEAGILIPTSINTPLPIISSFHTLSPEDAYLQLKKVLENNIDCRLPCWWGIVPGKTPWKEAEEKLVAFNNIGSPRGSADLFFISVHLPVPKEMGTLNHSYKIKEGIVVGINAYVYDLSPFLHLSNVLTEYGSPDEVFLKTFRSEENGTHPYQVDLFYEELGVLLEYSGGDIKNVEDTLQNCFADLDSPFVYIWSAEDEPITSKEAIDKYLILQPMPYPISLEKATGMNVNTFYETFKNPGTVNCLVTPAELWPEP